ncbi:conserved hypothetical protein [Ricinus communis]|uniref:RNase H type-1 domain-containing protein n=1 Tax=Ricinus communis TaxID=3988 RepID=B9ST83_RICCO|nr:conserved hypothetical protein [Ricinus communis]
MDIGWEPPPSDWVNLNVDGGVKDGLATSGGPLRNSACQWISGFMQKIAWSLGCRHVMVEFDSKEALAMIKGQDNGSKPNGL